MLELPAWWSHLLRTYRRLESGIAPPTDRYFDQVLMLEALPAALRRARKHGEDQERVEANSRQAAIWAAEFSSAE